MRKYWILLICLLLVICAIAACSTTQKVDWDATAYLITADSTEYSSFPMTIQGKILNKKGESYLSLDVDLPDDFRYSFYNHGPDGIGANKLSEPLPVDSGDLFVHDTHYDKVTNSGSTCFYVINIELGYFMAYWLHSPDSYLVASTDPNTTPQELISYFDAYFQLIIAPN